MHSGKAQSKTAQPEPVVDNNAEQSAAQEDTAEGTGHKFVTTYYDRLSKNPAEVEMFYQADSTFTRYDEGKAAGETFTGAVPIREHIVKLGYEKAKLEIHNADCQRSVDNSILVVVTGHIRFEGRPQQSFVQTVVLAPILGHKGYFYVRNDVVRYLGGPFGPSAAPLPTPKKSAAKEEAPPAIVAAASVAAVREPAPAVVAAASAPPPQAEPAAAAPSAQPAPVATPAAQPIANGAPAAKTSNADDGKKADQANKRNTPSAKGETATRGGRPARGGKSASPAPANNAAAKPVNGNAAAPAGANAAQAAPAATPAAPPANLSWSARLGSKPPPPKQDEPEDEGDDAGDSTPVAASSPSTAKVVRPTPAKPIRGPQPNGGKRRVDGEEAQAQGNANADGAAPQGQASSRPVDPYDTPEIVEKTVCVKGLPNDLGGDEIKTKVQDYFARFGKIDRVHFPNPAKTSFIFIQFDNKEAATNACDFQDGRPDIFPQSNQQVIVEQRRVQPGGLRRPGGRFGGSRGKGKGGKGGDRSASGGGYKSRGGGKGAGGDRRGGRTAAAGGAGAGGQGGRGGQD